MELLGQGRPLEPLEQLQLSLHTPSGGAGPAPTPPADLSWTVAIDGLHFLKHLGQVLLPLNMPEANRSCTH